MKIEVKTDRECDIRFELTKKGILKFANLKYFEDKKYILGFKHYYFLSRETVEAFREIE